MHHFSLLDDPLITLIRADQSQEQVTLPDVLARLDSNEVSGFSALQAHQQQAWYSFLVQLAAMIVAWRSDGLLPHDRAEWREGLLALSNGVEEAWALVVDDLNKPAFMQPPVFSGNLSKAEYTAEVPTPDALDVLITAKNHDVKRLRIHNPRPEHWLYALVTLQTMEGYLGSGNYGIVRMNGGYGSRPFLGLSGSLAWGSRFRRDVKVLKEARATQLEQYHLAGHALLWLLPWDGGKNSGVDLYSCDPWFIEICRRIRFTGFDGEIVCYRANSEAPRISVVEGLNGCTGDPWMPVNKAEAKALTVSASGFDYRLLHEILFSGDYQLPAALEPQKSEGEGACLTARVLVRGQCVTEGLHHRVIPIRRKALQLFAEPSGREKLGVRSRMRLQQTADARTKVLFPALAALLNGGRSGKIDGQKVAPWLDAFDAEIDAHYFHTLWASVEIEEQEAERQWQLLLWKAALRQLEAAEFSVPISTISRWEARSVARSFLHGNARKVLRLVFESSTESESDE